MIVRNIIIVIRKPNKPYKYVALSFNNKEKYFDFMRERDYSKNIISVTEQKINNCEYSDYVLLDKIYWKGWD